MATLLESAGYQNIKKIKATILKKTFDSEANALLSELPCFVFKNI